jgi:hypothetical protein
MFSKSAPGRLAGLLGSWAFFVLGFGWTSIALAGEWINVQDARKLERYAVIDRLMGERVAGRSAELRRARQSAASSMSLVRSRMATASRTIDRTPVPRRTVPVPLARAAKEENAKGVPPDEYFVELARRNGLNVVRLLPGQSLDADTGRAALRIGGGVWTWFGQSSGSRRVLTVANNTVIEASNGTQRELPPGALIRAGDTLVIPPAVAPQRRFGGAPPDAIPEKAAESREKRVTRLREKGESIFGGK